MRPFHDHDAFGSIFGVVSLSLSAAAGIGPFFAAFLFDATHGYQALLMVGIPAALLGSVAMLWTGDYRGLWPASREIATATNRKIGR